MIKNSGSVFCTKSESFRCVFFKGRLVKTKWNDVDGRLYMEVGYKK